MEVIRKDESCIRLKHDEIELSCRFNFGAFGCINGRMLIQLLYEEDEGKRWSIMQSFTVDMKDTPEENLQLAIDTVIRAIKLDLGRQKKALAALSEYNVLGKKPA